jgi:hypothetical protein
MGSREATLIPTIKREDRIAERRSKESRGDNMPSLGYDHGQIASLITDHTWRAFCFNAHVTIVFVVVVIIIVVIITVVVVVVIIINVTGFEIDIRSKPMCL